MRKFILSVRPEPPYYLRRTSLNWSKMVAMGWTEEELIQNSIKRCKQTGILPCETEEERTQCLADYAERHANNPNAPELDLPPVGPHWVVDESELPGGCVSPENDIAYFRNAWEWSD